jgi:hypothetical protein
MKFSISLLNKYLSITDNYKQHIFESELYD